MKKLVYDYDKEKSFKEIMDWINKFEDDLENGRFKLTIDDDKYYTLKRFEKD